MDEPGVKVHTGALGSGEGRPETGIQNARAWLGVELVGQVGADDADDLLVGLADGGLNHRPLLLSGHITYRKELDSTGFI